MAMVMDQQQQQQAYKHYCRVCKKGFSCGRALGGHMRAHGINDEPEGGPDDDNTSSCSEWGEDKPSQPPNNKRMYALRTNPARFKSYRSCENCGREFVSWKSFLEHGKCSSEEEDEEEEEGAYYYDSLASDADEDGLIGRAGWSKGKRSRRANSSAVPVSVCPSTSEEEDLANCLVMLSSARVDPVIVVEPEESCASASKEEDRRYHPAAAADKSKGPAAAAAAPTVPKGIFECKACKKVFSSHQALGGHRASHKKVKGCFAAKLHDTDVEAPPEEDNNNQEAAAAAAAAMAMAIVPFDNTPIAVVPLKKKSKVHECSICHRQFASGQALGGHKRCHWITSNSPDPTSAAKPQQQDPPSNNHHHHHHHHHELTLRPMFDPAEVIDLNMPAASMDGLSALRKDIGSPLRLDLPAAMYQQPWVDQDHKNKTTTSSNNMNNNYNNEGGCSMNMDDEVHSKVKLAKLSELKDINAGGEASPWLQVGIGSSGNEGSQENEKGEY